MTLNETYSKIINEQENDEAAQQIAEPKESKPEIPADAELKLSSNLAVELTETLNTFTAMCARIVKKKYATSETMKKLETLKNKIKDLINAGKNSVPN